MEFNSITNMLLGIAIGDAYGAAYEFRFKNRETLKNKLDFTKYTPNPSQNFNQIPGLYTDDTQMSIGLTEALLNNKEFDKKNLTTHFLKAFHRNPINGYARRFQAFLENTHSAEEFLKQMNPISKRNGAAMRSVPLGVLANEEEIIKYAEINASITHNTPKGIASSTAVGLLSHYFLYHKDKETDMFTYLDDRIRPIDEESANHFQAVKDMKTFNPIFMFGEKDKERGIPCDGMRTVGGVLYILQHYNNPVDVLKESVFLGGDTDSTASISLGINMIRHSIKELPAFLFDTLTNHPYGKDYIIDLGNKLNKKYII